MPRHTSSLRIPDAQSWQNEPNYSVAAAVALRQAYAIIAMGRGTAPDYLQAHACIFPFTRGRISLHQRLHVVYILAMVYAALDEHIKAIGCLDEALELAVRLKDLEAPVDLLYFRGSLFRTHSRYTPAVADFSNCLEFLQGVIHERQDPDDVILMAHILVEKAIAHYFLLQDVRVERCLKDARMIIPSDSFDWTLEANIHWSYALLDRQRGRLQNALDNSNRACDIYARLNSPLSEVRIRFLSGEIALDLAESYPDSTPLAGEYLYIAQCRSTQAVETVGTQDPSGQGLTTLLLARLGRLTHSPTVDSLEAIGATIRTAERLGDSALLCQAYSALGNEQLARGQQLGAANSYCRALDVANSSAIPALAAPAQRFFEMNVRQEYLDAW